MSRPKSIDSLLNGPASDIAPTVTDLSKREQGETATGPKPEPESAKGVKTEPVADATPTAKPKRLNPAPAKPKQKEPAQPENLSAAGQPIRVQISTSDGSEIAAALEEVRGNIPAAFQKNFNLGAFFKEVLQGNDAAIAAMIRNNLNGDAQ
ncbi:MULTISPECIES: hypothetical protein [unclassified Ruegeria]|jgi:hypothetical protein|uniref:hypothetical protein n=1 Tax=Ruegeria TaxID=97050 RepID=UPI00149109CC|nr:MULTISPECIES: hypothetical protein [unclassified Ruegeria]MBO9448201.1 hypothetical protein [Ruegeria sp. R14_0]NOC47336.1 hypothetical protein [Ruegeria sp. HKCCD7559]